MRDLASNHSSPIFGVTSEMALQVILYQIDMPCEGDEWVTSALKWITAATIWQIKHYNATGDELQSGVKILFFLSVKVSITDQRLLCLRWSFAIVSLQIRSKSVSNNGTYKGVTRDLHRINKKIYLTWTRWISSARMLLKNMWLKKLWKSNT